MCACEDPMCLPSPVDGLTSGETGSPDLPRSSASCVAAGRGVWSRSQHASAPACQPCGPCGVDARYRGTADAVTE